MTRHRRKRRTLRVELDFAGIGVAALALGKAIKRDVQLSDATEFDKRLRLFLEKLWEPNGCMQTFARGIPRIAPIGT